MKKLLALLLALVMVFAFASCVKPDDGNTPDDGNNPGGDILPPGGNDSGNDETELSVMTYEEYVAAEIDSEVLVEAYVQAHQAWWFDSKTNQGKITIYAADLDGAYFIYEMPCSEEDAAKLNPGTKIRVRGYKAEWEGEVEIIDATFEFIEGAEYIAESVDVTEYLGTDDLIDFQNQLVIFYGLTVKEIEYKNGAPGNDIYVTFTYGENDYSFCVESYLTGPDSDLYKAVQALEVGDVVDVEGFLYWYNGANPHITSVSHVGVMSYDEYVAADLQSEVTVEVYVQNTQSWWFDSETNHGKITVYAADHDGGYFIYEMVCSEEDAAKLIPGEKIRVHGYKAAWAGEVEIIDATFEFVDAHPWIAEPKDMTALLGTEELINYQNQLVVFYGLTVKGIEYKNGTPGNDIYVTLSYNGADYSFCVESYLTGPDSLNYQKVQTLKAGDVVDVVGFLYWYEGVNTHITSVFVK